MEELETLMQICGITLVFITLNLVILRENSNASAHQSIAYAILANTAVVVVLGALRLPIRSQFLAAAMFLAAVGFNMLNLGNAHGSTQSRRLIGHPHRHPEA